MEEPRKVAKKGGRRRSQRPRSRRTSSGWAELACLWSAAGLAAGCLRTRKKIVVNVVDPQELIYWGVTLPGGKHYRAKESTTSSSRGDDGATCDFDFRKSDQWDNVHCVPGLCYDAGRWKVSEDGSAAQVRNKAVDTMRLSNFSCDITYLEVLVEVQHDQDNEYVGIVFNYDQDLQNYYIASLKKDWTAGEPDLVPMPRIGGRRRRRKRRRRRAAADNSGGRVVVASPRDAGWHTSGFAFKLVTVNGSSNGLGPHFQRLATWPGDEDQSQLLFNAQNATWLHRITYRWRAWHDVANGAVRVAVTRTDQFTSDGNEVVIVDTNTGDDVVRPRLNLPAGHFGVYDYYQIGATFSNLKYSGRDCDCGG